MAESKFGTFFVLFLVIVIGAVFSQQIGDTVYEATNTFPVNNETINIAPARLLAGGINNTYPFTLAHNYTSVTSVRNQSENTLTLNTHYALISGYVYINNTVTTNVSTGTHPNSTFIYYNYVTDAYVSDSTSRTFLGLMIIFFVIGIFGFVAWIVYDRFMREWF